MNKFKFILIVLVFILPFFFAMYFYQSNVTQSIGTTNYGNFLDREIFIRDNNTRETEYWVLLQVLPNKCEASCEDTTYMLRQINIALGKDMNRIQRHALKSNKSNDHLEYLKNYPKVVVLETSENLYNILADMEESIFIVDPFGRLILGYDSNFNGKMLLKDLKKLLKYSKI